MYFNRITGQMICTGAATFRSSVEVKRCPAFLASYVTCIVCSTGSTNTNIGTVEVATVGVDSLGVINWQHQPEE